MVRQYVQVTDTQRLELIRLIHQEGYSIAKASKVTGIPYDNAKAINRTYLRERRVHKINYRLRYQKKTLNVSTVVSLKDESKLEESTSHTRKTISEKTSSNSLLQLAPQTQISSIPQNYNYQPYHNSTQDNFKLIPNSIQMQRNLQLLQLGAQQYAMSQYFPLIQNTGIQQQTAAPSIIKPSPLPNRGGLFSFPITSTYFNAQNYSKFFDFTNYSKMITQRVTQNTQLPNQDQKDKQTDAEEIKLTPVNPQQE